MSNIGNEDQLPAQGEELDDFDVEGHGLPEFMIGLSAASIVASGVGATAIALDNPVPGTTAGISSTVAGAQKDLASTQAHAEHLAAAAVEQTGETASDTLRQADRLHAWASGTATTTTAPVVQSVEAELTATTALAEQTLDDTTQLAQRVVDDPIETTDRLVDRTITTVRETRDEVLITTKDTLASAQSTVGTTVQNAEQVAADAAGTAVSTVGTAQEVLDPQASVQMDDGGVTVQAGAAGTSVTVTTGG